MPRNTNPSSILFPVELRQIAVAQGENLPIPSEEEPLFDNQDEEYDPIDHYRAVVRTDNGKVFSIVSNQYKLLHNSHALKMGKQAFCHLFPEAKESDFQIYDIRQTQTGSACHVDLIHKTWRVDVWEQDTWLPYLRVSNSYNRSRALTFDFGFVRSLCSNGIIFQKETIRAKFYHTKGKLDLDLSQESSFEQLKELADEFTNYMERMKKITVAKKLLVPLCLYLLDLDFDVKNEDSAKKQRELKRLDKVRDTLQTMLHRYVDEFGGTGYSALNAASDLATHHSASFSKTSDLQKEIGVKVRELLGQPKIRGRYPLPEILREQVELVRLVA